jgi:hypothetical protein
VPISVPRRGPIRSELRHAAVPSQDTIERVVVAGRDAGAVAWQAMVFPEHRNPSLVAHGFPVHRPCRLTGVFQTGTKKFGSLPYTADNAHHKEIRDVYPDPDGALRLACFRASFTCFSLVGANSENGFGGEETCQSRSRRNAGAKVIAAAASRMCDFPLLRGNLNGMKIEHSHIRCSPELRPRCSRVRALFCCRLDSVRSKP